MPGPYPAKGETGMQGLGGEADDPVEAAVALARDIAPDLESILVTIYPDADTLDTLRPGDSDVARANTIARAVAETMSDDGVEVFVQRADRSAFRRWIAMREDTPDTRLAWVDRGRLLRGGDAWRALGASPPPSEPPPQFPPAPGPTSDQLLTAHADGENGEFAALVGALIDAARDDVLDLALRKVRARQSDENAAGLRAEFLAIALGAALGPSGWAELVALPVALLPGDVPDAEALSAGLIASGCLALDDDLRFLPGWRSPHALTELSAVAMRRVLLDLLAGREPRDLPPGDTDELARRGFGVLVGLRVDWSIPIWDVIEAAGGLPEEQGEDDETPEERGRARAFDRWRSQAAAEHGGCVPLDLVPLSEVDGAISDFLDEAGGPMAVIEEIRTFIDGTRRAAGGENVVCRPQIVADTLELAIYGVDGRFLDRLTLAPDRLPASAESMLGLIGTIVPLVRDTPGR